ncbi:MAG: hypothetical protein K2X44_01300 [Magnetospirillum sp.]|nr:hypothetical protein [Magnetospirillum sp.]
MPESRSNWMPLNEAIQYVATQTGQNEPWRGVLAALAEGRLQARGHIDGVGLEGGGGLVIRREWFSALMWEAPVNGTLWFDSKKDLLTSFSAPARAERIVINSNQLKRLWPVVVSNTASALEQALANPEDDVEITASTGIIKAEKLSTPAPSLEEWYQERAKNWPPKETFPSRKKDRADAKAAGIEVTTRDIEEVRANHAPESWKRKGCRSKLIS